MLKTQKIFKSERHNDFTEVINKTDLSSNDEYKTFSNKLFHDIKYDSFLFDQISKFSILNIHKEYAHLF